jgi:hypothetical protein
MELSSLASPLLTGLSALLLGLLCYATVELIRVLIGIRVITNRLERLSDLGRVLDFFRKKR